MKRILGLTIAIMMLFAEAEDAVYAQSVETTVPTLTSDARDPCSFPEHSSRVRMIATTEGSDSESTQSSQLSNQLKHKAKAYVAIDTSPWRTTILTPEIFTTSVNTRIIFRVEYGAYLRWAIIASRIAIPPPA